MSKLVGLFEKHGTAIKLKKARLLYGLDDPATKMFFVRSGVVKIYRYSEDGKEIVFYLPGQGELVSILPYLLGGNHTHNAETLIDSEISWIEMAQFKSLVNSNPSILLEIAQILASRSKEYAGRVEAFVSRDALGRLAYIILELVNKYSIKTEGKISLPFPLTHQDLANLTGMFRETVSLAIQELTKAKVVSREKQIISVENKPLLEEYSRYGKQTKV